MALLEKYQKKRKFTDTPEPAGEVSRDTKGDLRFVIQKHAASHLHYDFRLEWEGVLKSWAVPKGPSLNPKDKHLAMAVEDHPLDYRTFEGIIPRGNYGAGEVIVWDEGTYTAGEGMDREATEKAMRAGLKKGKLVFTLYGEKLHGEFTLVKMHGREENAWLLMKHKDDEANSDIDITQENASVISGRTLEELQTGSGNAPAREKKSKQTKASSTKTKQTAQKQKNDEPMPHEIKPMLATLVDEPFDHEGWLFEIKWDGYRAIAEVDNGDVAFYSRNFKSYQSKFPNIYKELQSLEGRFVLDGEVVALDKDGKADFGALQNAEENQDQLFYYVFDLLYLDGEDLRKLPLTERKSRLKYALPDSDRIRYCDHIEKEGERFFKAATEQDLEGIIAKDGQSAYLSGTRSPAWLKVKTHQRQEAIICGYTQPRKTRQEIGALILGVYQNKTLTYIGHTGTGMDTATLKSLKKLLDPLTTEVSPFKTKPKTNAPAVWVKPQKVCEIKFQEWTGDGHMRQPVFMGLRDDKSPKDVTMEPQESTKTAIAEEEAKPIKTKRSVKAVERKTVSSKTMPNVPLTHLDKIYFPEKHYTKGDLIDYYHAAAQIILPYLKDRPLSLHRFPNGIAESGFYQKDNPNQLPKYVETTTIYSESNAKDIHYILCQNEETLLYLANLGCIEMNPWNSRVQKLDNPDYIVIDLDPGDISFDEVVTVARGVKDVLDEVDVPCYCKTSGATGLHVYVPLGAQFDYNTAKDIAHIIVRLVQPKFPKTTTLERSLSKRNPKTIYLDYLQNRTGQTLASVWSVRPLPDASVSTPLHWDEVKKGLSPKHFTMKNILGDIEDRDKLWQPVISAKSASKLKKLVS